MVIALMAPCPGGKKYQMLRAVQIQNCFGGFALLVPAGLVFQLEHLNLHGAIRFPHAHLVRQDGAVFSARLNLS